MTWSFRVPLLLFVAAAISFSTGCRSSPKPDVRALQNGWGGPGTAGLMVPFFDPDVKAVCTPPLGWKVQPLKTSENHEHEVWLSPTGDTAYGVIHFTIPLPVGEGLALAGFLSQMKKTEGEANLLSRKDDSSLPGIRFVASGGIYVIRANLMVATWEGWAVYAGTLKTGPVLQNELDLAIRARESTKVGRPEN
jgi:hypothetical protein